MASVTSANYSPSTMKNNQHDIFLASGCLTPKAFEHLKQGSLSTEEHLLARHHIDNCPLCSMAYEGLSALDLSTMTNDLEEVKQKLQIVRPLDFMPEKASWKTRLSVRLITILVVLVLMALLASLLYWQATKTSSKGAAIDTTTLFRLERKDGGSPQQVMKQTRASQKKDNQTDKNRNTIK